ncbi:hypothetical protein [Kribbella sp.]|uniref:alpha/beta fold hydrolase n=1 Tax=Kribbella sp. TaxID=1871183 RepID=UPI002D3D53AF|nr:hypothetical protein [Kribbella sp.]HZX01282.1 hypothetical protein [Kribbella sp.]
MGDVELAVTDRGGSGPVVVLLHGLAGSSRELLPTADALSDSFRADGLRARFDADVMRATIAAVQEDRWPEWEQLEPPTLAVFAEHGMFTAEQQDELIRRRPQTERAVIASGSHDAHLDAFDRWIDVLRGYLRS